MMSFNRNKIKGNSSTFILTVHPHLCNINTVELFALCITNIVVCKQMQTTRYPVFLSVTSYSIPTVLALYTASECRCRRYPKYRVIVRGPPPPVLLRPKFRYRRCRRRRQKRFVYTFYRGRAQQPR